MYRVNAVPFANTFRPQLCVPSGSVVVEVDNNIHPFQKLGNFIDDAKIRVVCLACGAMKMRGEEAIRQCLIEKNCCSHGFC